MLTKYSLGGILIAVQLNLLSAALHAQLLNVDFGSGTTSAKVGFAATGQSTNDYWNLCILATMGAAGKGQSGPVGILKGPNEQGERAV